MTTFVLIHGSWGGGWQWRGVAGALRAGGHQVSAPTLTGLGERAHAGSRGVTLATHIDDIADHLWFEDLAGVVLVGWSYGAAPIEAVADRMPERISMIVNLDGVVVREGEPLEDTSAGSTWEGDTAGAVLEPPTDEDLADVLHDRGLRRFVAHRLRPHPAATDTTPFPDGGGRRWQVPHVYLCCTEPPEGDPTVDEDVAEMERLRSDPRWDFRELPLNHLGLLYAPEVVAGALLEVTQARL